MLVGTGDHPPVCIKNNWYGVYESEIMQTHVNKLIKNKLMIADVKPLWGFRITLAPKPHQEEVKEIDDFVWRLCIDYIRLILFLDAMIKLWTVLETPYSLC